MFNDKKIKELKSELKNIKENFRTCDNCGGLFLKDKLIEQDKPKTKYYRKEYYHSVYPFQCSKFWTEIDKEKYEELKEEHEVKREFKRQLFCKNCNQN